MDPARFAAVATTLETSQDPPALIFGRPLKTYEVELPSADFAVEEKLPPGDRAVLQLAQALDVITSADVRAFLGLGPVLSPHLVARLARVGLLSEADLVQRSTFARRVEPVGAEGSSGLGLTGAGAEALAAGARTVVRQRPLRLLVSDDPLCVLAVLPPPMHARARRDLPLPPEHVPEPLRTLDALLRATPERRFEALGLGETLADIMGGDRIEGRLLGCSPGVPYDVRPAPESVEACLLVGVHVAPPQPLTSRVFAAILRRNTIDLRPLAHVPPLAMLPTSLRAPGGVDTLLAAAGLRPLLPGAAPPFPVLAGGAHLLELLGAGDRPAPVWWPLPPPGGGLLGRAHLRAVPASLEDAHEALYAFLARRPDALRAGLDRALATTWARLCTFWGWERVAPPDPAPVRERLWARTALRGVLCESRFERDLVTPYLAEVARG